MRGRARQDVEAMNVKPTDYDYIVVGAGSAGAALAARLSEPAYISVLLIEAGGKDRDPLIHLPMGCKVLLDNRRHNWDFDGPEPGLPDQKTIRLPRGRVLGGSSSINGMVFVRGHPRDFDEWRQLGCAGWSHADVLPYFKRLETYEGGADSCRGRCMCASSARPIRFTTPSCWPAARWACPKPPITTACRRKGSAAPSTTRRSSVGIAAQRRSLICGRRAGGRIFMC